MSFPVLADLLYVLKQKTNKQKNLAHFTNDFLQLYPEKKNLPNNNLGSKQYISNIDWVGFHHTTLMSGLYGCRDDGAFVGEDLTQNIGSHNLLHDTPISFKWAYLFFSI